MTETLPNDRRRRRRALVPALVASAAVLGGGTVAAAAPAAAAPSHVRGHLGSTWQSRVTKQVHVSGVAYDASAPHKSVTVTVYVNGHAHQNLKANRTSPRYDRRHHLRGRHAFSAVLRSPARATKVTLVVHHAGGTSRGVRTDTSQPRHLTPTGEKIVSVAKRYVGSRYVYGADGPTSFDCSGYSKFVYKRAKAGNLPHNSQAQRHAKHMHKIARSKARPGDLVFYLSGGSAYHVAIYAGHGKQYSATDPRQGVRHQPISSANVVFGSNWH
jgi:cell wall-associated NlpC family hydrolase